MIRCKDDAKTRVEEDHRVASPLVRRVITAEIEDGVSTQPPNTNSICELDHFSKTTERADSSSSRLCRQSARTPRRKDTHDAEDNIE